MLSIESRFRLFKIFLIAILIGVCYTVYTVVFSSDYFRIKNIEIEGVYESKKDDLSSVAKTFLDKPIFSNLELPEQFVKANFASASPDNNVGMSDNGSPSNQSDEDSPIVEDFEVPSVSSTLYGAMNSDKTGNGYDPLIGNYSSSQIDRIDVVKVYPNTVRMVVYEVVPVAKIRTPNGCYTLTNNNRFIVSSCDKVNIVLENKFDLQNLRKVLNIYSKYSFLQEGTIFLLYDSFVANVNGVLYYAPFDESIFAKNYANFINYIANKYSSINYVDLRSSMKVYINGGSV